ncbi:MAG TPA: site-2 protease family protein, partial [Solirubrobacterales bacterium]|nr:site-2 protease family protein [Solirubrobacterales bacterium]
MPLFRVGGISVGANWTWLLALGYLVVVLTGSFKDILGIDAQNTAFAYAVVVSFLFFGSIILHEFGHAIVARRNGIGVLGIDLWLLGGVAKMDRDPSTPGVDFRVSAGGPLVTALISIVCLGLAFAIDPDQARRLALLDSVPNDNPWVASLAWLGAVNAFILAFNLIPAYPLDGGRIARSIAWRITGNREKATTFAAVLGRGFGYLLVILGVWTLSVGNALDGVILIFMGMSLAQSAREATVRGGLLGEASKLTVADVMDRQPVAMPGDVTAERALDEYF